MSTQQQEVVDTCPICFDKKADYKTVCNHFFCVLCIFTWKKNSCPICRHHLFNTENSQQAESVEDYGNDDGDELIDQFFRETEQEIDLQIDQELQREINYQVYQDQDIDINLTDLPIQHDDILERFVIEYRYNTEGDDVDFILKYKWIYLLSILSYVWIFISILIRIQFSVISNHYE